MAWSQGNIQWTFPFKSLNNTACRIDVYKRGYTGTFVYSLKAAADPFFYEEDEDSDLLNNVVRYRTGYIRVIEEYAHGWLSEIYPTNAFDRWVEVYYGDELIFNGYIQRQDFNSELIPVPRVIELPVISPMGLFEQLTFSNTLYLPPTSATLGELLDQVLANTNYEYVYRPKIYGYPNTVSLSMSVFTLAVCPWDEEYHHSMNVSPTSKVMKGKTYYFLIEAICKAFGWICHDTPTALIFTAFDYEGVYYKETVGHIGESGYGEDADIPSSEQTLTDYMEIADDNATETTILPDTGIEIKYEEDSGKRSFDFQRTYVPSQDPVAIMPSFIPDIDNYPNHAEIFSFCNLLPVPGLFEISSSIGALSFDNNDNINVGIGCVAWNGKEGFLCSMASYPSGSTLFYIRFYLKRRSGMKFGFKYDVIGRRDGQLGGLAYNPDIDDFYIYTSFDASNQNYVQVTFKYRYNGDYPQLPTNALLFIHNIQLEVFEDGVPYSEYIYTPTKDSDTIPATGNPSISSEVEMPISLYRIGDNLIGTSVRSTKVTEYPYLFQTRKELTGRFRITNQLTFPHVKLFSYMNKKWRIIAQRFDPWNDEVTLTMQNSSVL